MLSKKLSLAIFFLLSLLILSGCRPINRLIPLTATLPPTPTPTIAPATPTPVPTATATALPTPTPTPSPLPTATLEPLQIALLAPMSGSIGSFGESTQRGVQMAVDEWNEQGGVLGRQVEIVIEDSQCSAEPAVDATKRVIDAGIHYIIGEICSSASIPISEFANPAGVIMISPTSTNPNVTINSDGAVKEFVFRACFIDPYQGSVMAAFAWEQGYKTAYIMADQNNNYSSGLAEAFDTAFTDLGGEIVGRGSYDWDDQDFRLILGEVSVTDAEVLFVPDYYNVVNLVAQQARELGITAVMMGGDGWDSSDLDLSVLEGSFFSNHFALGDTDPMLQEWIAQFEDRYLALPDAIAALGYDTANLLLAAIQETGSDDPDLVKDVLAKIDYMGITGAIQFDENHDPVKPAVIITIQDGEFVFFKRVEADRIP